MVCDLINVRTHIVFFFEIGCMCQMNVKTGAYWRQYFRAPNYWHKEGAIRCYL
jgi:hypothetical protein